MQVRFSMPEVLFAQPARRPRKNRKSPANATTPQVRTSTSTGGASGDSYTGSGRAGTVQSTSAAPASEMMGVSSESAIDGILLGAMKFSQDIIESSFKLLVSDLAGKIQRPVSDEGDDLELEKKLEQLAVSKDVHEDKDIEGTQIPEEEDAILTEKFGKLIDQYGKNAGDIAQLINHQDEQDRTLLHYAVLGNTPNLYALLEKYGAKSDIQDSDQKTVVHYLKMRKDKQLAKTSQKSTPVLPDELLMQVDQKIRELEIRQWYESEMRERRLQMQPRLKESGEDAITFILHEHIDTLLKELGALLHPDFRAIFMDIHQGLGRINIKKIRHVVQHREIGQKVVQFSATIPPQYRGNQNYLANLKGDQKTEYEALQEVAKEHKEFKAEIDNEWLAFMKKWKLIKS